jgi:hypothetical protein
MAYVEIWVEGDKRAPRREFGPLLPSQAEETAVGLRAQIAEKALPLQVVVADRNEPRPSLAVLAEWWRQEREEIGRRVR